MFHVDFKMFVDRPGILAAIERKRLKVLTQAGAYARTAMRRQIRPQLKRKNRIVLLHGHQYFVPQYGKVVDLKTKKPITTKLAAEVRLAYARQNKELSAGKPPRRGPTDLLRSNIFFGVDKDSQSVVIGPRKFSKQPHLSGATSVPELLEIGGTETIRSMGNDVRVLYQPHPYAGPTLPIAEKKFKELIETVPLK